MKAVSDGVRAQSIDQKVRLKKSLLKELASARDVTCQSEREKRQKADEFYNRRGSKDSQLK